MKQVFVCPECGSENNVVGPVGYSGFTINNRICNDCGFQGLFLVKEIKDKK